MLDAYEGTYLGLLFNLAAVMAVSLTFGGVADANVTVGVQQIQTGSSGSAQMIRTETGPVRPIVSPLLASTADGGTAALHPGGGAASMAALSVMSGLGSVEISAMLAQNPANITTLLAAPPAAAAVGGWWRDLGPSQRQTLTTSAPRVVGNLDGIPFRARNAANLHYLDSSFSETRERLAEKISTEERGILSTQLAVLTQVQAAVDREAGKPSRYLVQLDPTDGGRAAIAVGNPDTADYVTYLIPGMNYGVQEQMVNWAETAEALRAEEESILRLHRVPGERMPTVAVIAWIGYQTPDVFTVGGLDRAERGADQLESAWKGLRVTRGDKQPRINVIGHSYGSTVSLVALARGSMVADSLVLVGSPGGPAQSVNELFVTPGQVFVGEADWDPAVDSAFFGSDPGGAEFGANRMGVSGARDAVTGRWLESSVGHNAYFTPGSESLHNLALVGTNFAKLVTGRSE